MQGIVGADLGQLGLAKDVRWKFRFGSHVFSIISFAKRASSTTSSFWLAVGVWLDQNHHILFDK